MATFGNTLDAYALDPTTGLPLPGVELYAWADETGGAPLLSFLSGLDGSFGWEYDTDADGQWVSAGLTGPRVYVPNNDALGNRATTVYVDERLATKANAATVGTISAKVDTTETRVGTVEDELVWDALALRNADARGQVTVPPATITDVFSSTTGMTAAGPYFAASVGGTSGVGIVPRFPGVARLSYRVKCTKATAGSQSYAGLCDTTPGTLPTGTTPTVGVGYLQGTGLVMFRENIGAVTTLVADTGITDGDEYDVTILADVNRMTSSQPTATPENKIAAAYQRTDGTNAGTTSLIRRVDYAPNWGNVLVKTNVAAGAVTGLQLIPAGAGKATVVSETGLKYSTLVGEDVWVHMPAKPNGLAVIACHGHGGSYVETGFNSTTIRPTWTALVAAGYTVFVPDLGGDLWGNDTVQDLLETLHGHIVDDFRLDPRVFLWGNSMGGAAVQNAVSQRRFPVRAARLVDPVCDLSLMWDNASYASMKTAYNSDPALRDAYNPVLLPASSFEGVPLLFSASPSDTVVTKTGHTDVQRARLAGTVDTQLVTTAGAHNVADAFRAQQTLAWFQAHV